MKNADELEDAVLRESPDKEGQIAYGFTLKYIFFKFIFYYLFIFRARGRERERERNIPVWLPLECPLLGTWPTTQTCALTGNQTSDPLVCR